MKALISIILLLVVSAAASDIPNAPQPNTSPVDHSFSSGFSADNQLYLLQGWGVTTIVGPLTGRPWLGAATGVGSCMLWRAVHDQNYTNDRMFSSNRVAFCALGSAVGYATDKWVLRVHRNKYVR
jgi:hypothetical protein